MYNYLLTNLLTYSHVDLVMHVRLWFFIQITSTRLLCLISYSPRKLKSVHIFCFHDFLAPKSGQLSLRFPCLISYWARKFHQNSWTSFQVIVHVHK